MLLKDGAIWYVCLVLDAAKTGDLAILQKWHHNGLPIDKPTAKGLTPLMLAAQNGHEHVAAWLLKQGANPNHVSGSGRTPLMEAAEKGDEGIVDLLLNVGADPEIEDAYSLNAWMIAKEKYRTNIEKKLAAISHIPEHTIKNSCLVSFSHEDIESGTALSPLFMRSALLNKIIIIGTFSAIFFLQPEDMEKNGWSLFIDPSNSLAVVVPEVVANTKQLHEKFGFKNLLQIKSSQLTDTIYQMERDAPVEQLMRIFENCIDASSPGRPTRFALLGHGSKGKSIAEIPVESFGKILNVLTRLRAEFVYILSCFTAGSNLLEMQKQLSENIEIALKANMYAKCTLESYAKRLELKFEKVLTVESEEDVYQEYARLIKASSGFEYPKTDYIIVVQATADVPTHGSPRLKTLFTQLDAYFKDRTPLTERSRLNEILRMAMPQQDVFRLASVRFPGTVAFFHAADLGNMEIVTRYRLQKSRVSRLFEVAKLRSMLRDKQKNKVFKGSEEEKKLIENIKAIEAAKIIVPVAPNINYIQFFSCDAHDINFNILGRNMPSFILKIYDNAYCVIKNIQYTSSADRLEHAVEDFIHKGFIKIFEPVQTLSNKCWLIQSAALIVRGIQYNLNNIAIYIKAPANERDAGVCSWMYFDQAGYHGQGPEAAKNEGGYKSKLGEWVRICTPSEKALIETSSGLESKQDCDLALESFLESYKSYKRKI
jgi:hypothetical protein